MVLHPEFAPITLIACFSLLLPLSWHWRASNTAILSMIFWLFFSNLIFAVDALVWGNSVAAVIPVWCDITTKFIIGANFALPAACLCISIHLEQVASLRMTRATTAEKRHRQWFEASMCFGLPILFMGLHFIVQGHRFDIIEGYGCRPTTYFSIPSIFIVWIPPLVMSIGALGFSALALRHFLIRRLTFAAHLERSSSGFTTSRYLRLMSMSAIQMIWSISVTSYALWFTAMAVPIRPWTTWDDVHSDFSRTDQFPVLFTPPFIERSYYALWWMIPLSTFLFVAFFSFGQDAMEEYKKCFNWIRSKIFHQSSLTGKEEILFVSFPSSKSTRLTTSNLLSTSSTSDSSTLPPYSATIERHSISSMHKSIATDDTLTYAVKNTIFTEGKAIGSYADLTIQTPSTISLPTSYGDDYDSLRSRISPPLPTPPSRPNLRPLVLLNASESTIRPLSYPSYESSHRSYNPTN